MACRIYGQKFKFSTRCSNPAFPLAAAIRSRARARARRSGLAPTSVSPAWRPWPRGVYTERDQRVAMGGGTVRLDRHLCVADTFAHSQDVSG